MDSAVARVVVLADPAPVRAASDNLAVVVRAAARARADSGKPDRVRSATGAPAPKVWEAIDSRPRAAANSTTSLACHPTEDYTTLGRRAWGEEMLAAAAAGPALVQVVSAG